MPESTEDYCERCGELGHGSRKLMFYGGYERFPKSPVVREFFCVRCQRILKVYAIVGLSILLAAVGAIVVTTIWATRQGSLPIGP